jgi:hypothetical protein
MNAGRTNNGCAQKKAITRSFSSEKIFVKNGYKKNGHRFGARSRSTSTSVTYGVFILIELW